MTSNSEEQPQKLTIEDAKTIAATGQSVFTVLAIIAGLLWFCFRGETQSRLDLDHKTALVKLDKHGWLASLDLRLENKGNTIVRVEKVEVRVQQVLPLGPIIQERLEAGYHVAAKGEAYVDWPLIEETTHNPRLRLRPGESYVVSFELMVPPEIEVVKLSSFVSDTSGIVGWDHSTLEQVKE